jgi:phosphoenolpyruvate-protein kinase (PTS system EI component)
MMVKRDNGRPGIFKQEDPPMTKQVRCFLVVVYVVVLFTIPSFAQTPDRRQTKSSPQAPEQPTSLPQNANSTDAVANEIALLRKSLQTLNARLLEITNKALAGDANQSGSANDKQNPISKNLALLTQAEQRAEGLRRQLLELIEKEALYKSRLVQIDEDMRPESIERALNPYGTTRTAEMRDTRRRVLENDRRGYESLLNLTTQSRIRLEDDVKQADFLVSKLRQRVLPLIEKDIEKITHN